MADIQIHLRGLLETLPPAERRVVEYIFGHPDEVLLQSVQACAAAAGVSASSVGRAAQKAGCRDFKELKIELAKAGRAASSVVYQDITERDTDDAVVKKIFAANLRSLEDTLKILDIGKLTQAAGFIVRSRHVIFIGIGSSGNIARDASLRFAHLGVQTESYCEPYDIMIRGIGIPKAAVVIGLSHSGHSEMTVKGLEFARRNGAVTVGISNYPGSPLEAECRIFFRTAFQEPKVRSAAISSKLSQIGILDALYGLVAHHLRELKTPQELNTLVEQQFRISKSKRKKG